jgi:hypothetical protein
MVTAHFVMQGKGGVGKSLSAGLLYQYLEGRGLTVQAMDTDPINKTLAGYKAFNVTPLEVMKGNDIDQRQFDLIIEAICDMPDGAHMVVDNGASSFVSLCGYIKESRAFDILTGEGHTVLIHSVVTGGQALGDTLSNLDSLIDHFYDTPLIVWLNPFFGEITLDGADFYSFKVYQRAPENYKAVIELPLLKPDTFGKDFEELIAKRWSFNQAVNSRLPLMTRSRLFNIWQDIERVIDEAHLV